MHPRLSYQECFWYIGQVKSSFIIILRIPWSWTVEVVLGLPVPLRLLSSPVFSFWREYLYCRYHALWCTIGKHNTDWKNVFNADIMVHHGTAQHRLEECLMRTSGAVVHHGKAQHWQEECLIMKRASSHDGVTESVLLWLPIDFCLLMVPFGTPR